MNNTNKEFDAVAMMRQIRDPLSQQFQDWTLAEQQQYIRSHINVPKQERRFFPVRTGRRPGPVTLVRRKNSHDDSNQRF